MKGTVPSEGMASEGPGRHHRGDFLKLFRGGGLVLIGRASGRGLHLITQVALGRALGAELFGVFAIGWTALRMLAFPAILGLDRGVIRYGSRFWGEDPGGYRGVVLQALGTALVSSLVCAGILLVSAPWLARDVFHDPRLAGVFRWFALGLILYALMKVAAAATRVSQRMGHSVAAQDIGQPGSNLLLVLLLVVFLGWGLGAAVGAAVASFGIGLGLALYFIASARPGPGRSRPRFVGRELVYFSIPTSIAGMFGAYLVWVDRMILGLFRDSAEVGIYQAVSQFAILFAVILAAVETVASPMIARMHHEGETKRIEQLYRGSTKWALYLSLPLFLVICLAPRDLLFAVFGGEYVPGWLALVVLATAQLVNVGTGAVHSLLIMTGHQKAWMYLSGGALAANVVLNVALIPRWGILGAAVATGIALALLFVAGVSLVRGKLGIWPYDRRFLKLALGTAVAAAVIASVGSLVDTSATANVLLTLVLALLAFGGTLAVVGFDAEDRVLIDAVRAAAGGARRTPPPA